MILNDIAYDFERHMSVQIQILPPSSVLDDIDAVEAHTLADDEDQLMGNDAINLPSQFVTPGQLITDDPQFMKSNNLPVSKSMC